MRENQFDLKAQKNRCQLKKDPVAKRVNAQKAEFKKQQLLPIIWDFSSNLPLRTNSPKLKDLLKSEEMDK
jgi:hypothetical protein